MAFFFVSFAVDTFAVFDGKTQIDDDSLNVGYSNLPTIGHVSRLWLDEEDNQIRMIINLHMTGLRNSGNIWRLINFLP